MKRFTMIGMTALAVMLCAVAQAYPIRVRVNGDLVYFQGTQPQQINGRVLVPFRGILEQMGANVDWMPENQTVIATRGDKEILLTIGSRTAAINGRDVQLDVPAMTLGGYTMVPLRFVSEALGADVTWLSAMQTVMIDTGSSPIRAYRRPLSENDRPYTRRNYRTNTRRVFLDAGTVIPVRLDERLSSNESAPGDRFTTTVESDRDAAGLPAGTQIEGVVREAIPSKGGKPGVLDVDFRRIIFPGGDSRTISASLTSLDSKDITRSSSGRLMATSRKGDERLKWVGIGAGAGLLIGTVTRGNALVDALLGAGAGYLYNELQRKGAGNVNLRPGTEMGVRFDRQFAFNRTYENP
jgi:hypothetical protein